MNVRPVSAPAPDLKEAALATLLKIKNETGCVSNADVRRAALVMQVTERTVRRMLARGYVRRPRDRWEPGEEFTTLLVRGQGSVAGIHQHLTEQGMAPGCHVRTMQRYAATYYDQRVLAGARGGYEALRQGLPTLDRHYEHINEEWAMDHAMLPIWCLMPDGTVDKPWLTTILDAASRFDLASTLGPYTPTIEENVETIAVAGVGFTEDDVYIGGQPEVLRSDRGGDLVSRAMTIGLLETGTQRAYAEAYHPNQNGLIERWHRTIKNELVPYVEGRDRKKWTPSDPRTESVPPPADQVLPLATVQLKVAEWIRHYNFERTHRTLGGLTPFQRWAQDDAEITHMDEQAIRAAMTQQMERTVNKGRIQWDERFYHLDGTRVEPDNETSDRWRARLEGKKVLVRFLPARYEYVEIYTIDGTYACKATWSRLIDSEDAANQVADRRAATKTLSSALAVIAEQDAASKAALRAEALNETGAIPDDDDLLPQQGPTPSPKRKRKSRAKPESPAAERRRMKAEQKAADIRAQNKKVSDALKTGTDDWF